MTTETLTRPHVLLSSERQEMAELIARADNVQLAVRRLMLIAEQAETYELWATCVAAARELLPVAR